jgi:hypothetical protein
VHVDSCKGALLATMPLGTAYRKNGVVTLPTADVKGTGGIHDLCFEVENPDELLTRTTGQASTAVPSVHISPQASYDRSDREPFHGYFSSLLFAAPR